MFLYYIFPAFPGNIVHVPTKEIIDDNTLHLSYCLIKRQWLKEDRLTAATVPALQQSFPPSSDIVSQTFNISVVIDNDVEK